MLDFASALRTLAASYLCSELRVDVFYTDDEGLHHLELADTETGERGRVVSRTDSPAELLGSALVSFSDASPLPSFQPGEWLTCPHGIVEPETVRCEPCDGALARLTKIGTGAYALVRRPAMLLGAVEVVFLEHIASVLWLPPSGTYWSAAAWRLRFLGDS